MRVTYNASVLKDCFYKVKNSLTLLTHCKYDLIFKELAADDSNMSFEQCRVVLVVSPITNADMQMPRL